MDLPIRNDLNSRGIAKANPSKHKDYSYGQESVDSFAITKLKHKCCVRQIKLDHKMGLDGVKYFGIHLLLPRYGNGDITPCRELRGRFQFSLLDSDGTPSVVVGGPTMNPVEFKQQTSCSFSKLMLMSELLHASKRLLENDTLNIHLRVWIEKGVKHQSHIGGNAVLTNEGELGSYRGMKMLSFQMGNLFNKKVMTDIKILTGTATFDAHKAVLAGRSPVFAAMFASDVHEESRVDIFIEEFDNVVVQDILHYLYTGEAQLLEERSNDLLKIAVKYKLTELKESCESMLANNLTIENAAETLVLAQTQKANFLKCRAVEFISRNREFLKKNQAFKNVLSANPNLAMELYLY
ncbi:unnamed protein product [Orchesella dallaii]|uniref:BTB domain-containing protein n=1 Tax=Orchesella dallaii TaxID=48710 RepID=A0ABP1R2M0_9HEXA